MSLTDDDIYAFESKPKITREAISNNFVTRVLFAGIKLKYQELEYENEEWNKYDESQDNFCELDGFYLSLL